MNVDLDSLQAAGIPSARGIGRACVIRSGRSLVACSLLGLTVAAVVLGAPSVMAQTATAQDTAAPKVKTAKPKAAAKAKEAPADDEGEPKTAAAPVKRDPAQAQRTFESGVKLLQAGKAEPAIQSFTSVISGGNVPPQLMARALHQRGAAYRAAGKPAQAVSDLTSALWLKGGLSDAERADAVQQRTAAYREAGLPDQSDPGESKAPPKRTAAATAPSGLSAGGSVAAPAVTTASLAPETAPPAQAPSSPLANLFGNLFGGGASSQAAAASPAPVAPQPAQPTTSAWSSATAVTPAPAPKTARAAAIVAPAPPAAAAPATPAKAVASGGVHARMIQSSEAEANTLAGRLKSEFGTHLAGRTPEISKAQFGGMGAFFQVRVGPYKTPAEAQAFCAKIKGTGADCVAVTQ